MGKKSKLFHAMTGKAAPVFLLLLPCLWIVFIGVGWTQDDYVEESVYNIWSRQSGNYFKDKEYLEDVTGGDDLSSSNFLAMAISRDGENLFTKDRLEEIRARMEETELTTTVEYDGEVYDWQDLCLSNTAGLGTTYQFPCLRLSPMDLFQEAEWFFNDDEDQDRITWYNEIIQKRLVEPRVPRFGIMQGVCSSEGEASVSDACDEILELRTNQTYATEQGYPPGYANPLQLFSDVSDLELNHPCRICYETGFESAMEQLTAGTQGTFGVMALELQRYLTDLQADTTTDPQDLAELGALLQKVGKIAQEVDRAAVEEFYRYYVTRGLYADLGAAGYMASYAAVMDVENGLFGACMFANGGDITKCPTTVTEEEAELALVRHADNAFSGITLAGSPFPFWSTPDGTGFMFAGDFPVSGSGIDLNGARLSSAAYLDITRYGTAEWTPLYSGDYADPLTPDPNWVALVETDPVYKWFLAGETPMTSQCGNGDLTGTNTQNPQVDVPTSVVAAGVLTQRWCTQYNTPFMEAGTETEQHFAKMFYDLVIDSPGFLGIVQGQSDPYVWTSGQGCGYELKGMRDPYTNQTEGDILQRASRELYYIDEGVSVGALDRNLLIGDVVPSVQEYDFANPLTHVGVIQSIYVTGTTSDLVDKVKNCNRPRGPVDITEEDAEEILELWKEAMEDTWTRDWDDKTAGEVQFVGFYDDQGGAPGTFSVLLGDITLDNGQLMIISIVLIGAVSCIFLFSCDLVESRVLITAGGVALVIMSYFAALGFGIICGIKININTAWTLPFIILGLGVDDMYIVLLALKKRAGYTKRDFIAAMKDVVVPVSMTSLVNASMFAVMNISDIQAIYKTAQAALISVIFLYLTIIFCFPAYCWLDMKRQAAGRYDVLFCKKEKQQEEEQQEEEVPVNEEGDEEVKKTQQQEEEAPVNEEEGDEEVKKTQQQEEEAPVNDEEGDEEVKKTRFQQVVERYPKDSSTLLYDKVYYPLVFGDGCLPTLNRIFIWLATAALIGVGIWGITERELGLGVEEFFPSDHQAGTWAETRSDSLASWGVQVNWGALDYGDPDEQMRMIKQFEDIVETPHIAETDTKQLWMADLVVWTTRQCAENFDRDDPEVKECGRDQIFPDDGTPCSGTWRPNIYNLREKTFDDPRSVVCNPFEGGVCRPTEQMHFMDLMELEDPSAATSWCPTFQDWSDAKLQYCIQKWREHTGGGGDLVVEEDTATPYEDCEGEFHRDDEVRVPIPYSASPSMFAYDLFSHEDTVDMIEETRDVCDDDKDLHCFMTGIPFDYWEQYLYVEQILLEIGGIAVAVGFGVSLIFLCSQLYSEGQHGKGKIFKASLAGSSLIALTCFITLVVVVGLSSLFNVNWTAFGMMSFVLSVGFSVEYSVHVVHRFLSAPNSVESAKSRVEYTMQFLTLPLTLSFISSTIGVACLAFTEFEFNSIYFFRPLIIVMFVSYFVGCWFLPVALMFMDCDFMKVGPRAPTKSVWHMGEEEESREAMAAASAGVEPDDDKVEEAAPEQPEAAAETATEEANAAEEGEMPSTPVDVEEGASGVEPLSSDAK